MKKRIIYTVIFALVLTIGTPQAILWCKKSFSTQGTIHKAIENEYLSKISLQYYGTPKYWRDLAVINRTPYADLVFAGDEIFIPSKKSIDEIHNKWILSEDKVLINTEKKQNRTESIKTDMFRVSNESYTELTDFVEKYNPSHERKLAIPIILAGCSGLLLSTIMLGFISYKPKTSKS